MHRKTATLIDTTAEATGEISAFASVFNNVDRGGDKILPGAFANVLNRLREKGNPIPIVVSHRHDDPMAIIGAADPADVQETAHGLLVEGQLDIGDNELAAQVHRLMKKGTLRGWSFAYTVAPGGQEKKDGVNEVTEIGDLFEVGPTLVGMNPEAELVSAKAASTYDFQPEWEMLNEAHHKAMKVHEEARRQRKEAERAANEAERKALADRPIKVESFEA
jgi:HK97 family phage prohead protease